MPRDLDAPLAPHPPREPVPFNPYRPEPRRAERRTRITYRDPTANTAIGNIASEEKKKRTR